MDTMEISKVLAENFANEWLVVTENTREQAEQLYESAREIIESGSETPVAELSDKLRDEWETLAEQIKDLTDEHISETAGLYVAQMLQGWGSYAFDIIARQVIEQVREGK